MTDATTSPPKTGRPKKAAGAARDCRAAFRLTTEELEAVEREAGAAGLTVSAYCRRVVLRHRVTPAARGADAAALSALNRVGVNLNQVARHLNVHGRPPRDLAETLAEVRRAVEALAGGGT